MNFLRPLASDRRTHVYVAPKSASIHHSIHATCASSFHSAVNLAPLASTETSISAVPEPRWRSFGPGRRSQDLHLTNRRTYRCRQPALCPSQRSLDLVQREARLADKYVSVGHAGTWGGWVAGATCTAPRSCNRVSSASGSRGRHDGGSGGGDGGCAQRTRNLLWY